jgi:hypothetical protein
MVFTLILILLFQEQGSVIWDGVARFSQLASPFLVIGLLVGMAYFFWHSKSRDELTRNNAELKALSETRLETIKDLRQDLSEAETTIAKGEGRITTLSGEVLRLERENENKAKIEFRLRAEVADLERALGRSEIHQSGSPSLDLS